MYLVTAWGTGSAQRRFCSPKLRPQILGSLSSQLLMWMPKYLPRGLLSSLELVRSSPQLTSPVITQFDFVYCVTKCVLAMKHHSVRITPSVLSARLDPIIESCTLHLC